MSMNWDSMKAFCNRTEKHSQLHPHLYHGFFFFSLGCTQTKPRRSAEDLRRDLDEAHFGCSVPGLPHGVLVGGWQAGMTHRATIHPPHYPLCQQKIPEQGSHQQILHDDNIILFRTQKSFGSEAAYLWERLSLRLISKNLVYWMQSSQSFAFKCINVQVLQSFVVSKNYFSESLTHCIHNLIGIIHLNTRLQAKVLGLILNLMRHTFHDMDWYYLTFILSTCFRWYYNTKLHSLSWKSGVWRKIKGRVILVEKAFGRVLEVVCSRQLCLLQQWKSSSIPPMVFACRFVCLEAYLSNPCSSLHCRADFGSRTTSVQSGHKTSLGKWSDSETIWMYHILIWIASALSSWCPEVLQKCLRVAQPRLNKIKSKPRSPWEKAKILFVVSYYSFKNPDSNLICWNSRLRVCRCGSVLHYEALKTGFLDWQNIIVLSEVLLRPTLIGVVKQAVKTSAGNSGFCGSISPAWQAAKSRVSCMGSSILRPGILS